MVQDERINLGDGAGGELMQRMLSELILPLIRKQDTVNDPSGIPPSLLDDSAVVDDVAFTIDGHTVWPLEFPGGDIGSLSVIGTINDLWVVGARPRALALSMVIEEGTDRDLVRRISSSIGRSSDKAGVQVVTGDTKVVEKGGVKGMYISSAGIGWRHPLLLPNLDVVKENRSSNGLEPSVSKWLRDDNITEGDQIILSGSVGDHGISLLSFREGYGYETELRSDLASVGEIMEAALEVGGIVSAKDLTRGGLANGLNEWVSKSGHVIEIDEEKVPVKNEVLSACDMLGFDPFEIGNEGKVIIGVVPGKEDEVLEAIRKTHGGKDAAIIGKVMGKGDNVILETEVGGKRIMDPPYGDPVPRIC
jgi:hydrogenase expression/formation protein HypE